MRGDYFGKSKSDERGREAGERPPLPLLAEKAQRGRARPREPVGVSHTGGVRSHSAY